MAQALLGEDCTVLELELRQEGQAVNSNVLKSLLILLFVRACHICVMKDDVKHIEYNVYLLYAFFNVMKPSD